MRSRIVLAAADGLSNLEIAELVGVSRPTVTRWRNRFSESRLEGLLDEPRPGRPRTVSDEQVERIVVTTLESKPKDATHWSTRSLAAHLAVSQNSVWRAWQAFGLQPHRQEKFKLSTDPQFIEKVYDICGLYLNPPERAVVLCMDEKSQIQALDRTQPILPMLPGTPERATHDFERHGTSSLYAALELTTGKVIGSLHERHRAIEFLKFLKTIDHEVPAHLDIHLVLDNASSHKTPKVKRWLDQHPRFHLHFTPTSSSWLNLVERWFGELTNKLLKRGAHRSVRALNADIRAWIETWNENPRPYLWTKPAERILESIARYCQRINQTGDRGQAGRGRLAVADVWSGSVHFVVPLLIRPGSLDPLVAASGSSPRLCRLPGLVSARYFCIGGM